MINREQRKLSLPKVVAAIVVAGVLTVLLICWSFRESIDNLPTGDLIGAWNSPDKNYTVKAYLCGGDMSDHAVRLEVIDNKAIIALPRNIYWNYHCQSASVVWLNSETIQVNGRTLNVRHDFYDFRM